MLGMEATERPLASLQEAGQAVVLLSVCLATDSPRNTYWGHNPELIAPEQPDSVPWARYRCYRQHNGFDAVSKLACGNLALNVTSLAADRVLRGKGGEVTPQGGDLNSIGSVSP